jgi:uncharacterized protein YjdB
MITFLDYDTMKTLAKDRGVYWYSLGSPGATGNIRNPTTGDEATFQTVTAMTGEGQLNAYHNGLYIFVDTFGTADTPPATVGTDIDATPTADLPVHPISGADYYTEGIVYMAGSINFVGLGATTAITDVETPPRYEQHYLHNDAGWDPNLPGKLPIRSDPSQQPVTFNLNVHIKGAVYVDGEFQGGGNPSIFGSITTERGYTGGGTPEIWYNYNLNVSEENDTFCINCCTLEISPASASVVEGDTTVLTAVGAAGAVIWTSSDPAVATVDPASGKVNGVAVGATTIKATDGNNCVARATIDVTDQCLVFSVDPPTATINTGDTQTFTTLSPPSGTTSITWSSTDPAVATIDPVTGKSAGTGSGTVVITATETPDQCPDAEALLTVNCGLAVAPASANFGLGGSINLTASNEAGGVTWTTNDPAGATTLTATTGLTTTYKPSALGTYTVTATDGSSCIAVATITVSAAACTLTVTPAASTIASTDTVGLTANSPTGAVTWSSSDTNIATVSPAAGLTTAVTGQSTPGTATITAMDSVCSQSATVEVVDCSSFAISGNPGSLEIAATVDLTVPNPAPRPVTWSANPGGKVWITPSGLNNYKLGVEGVDTAIVTVTADNSICSNAVSFDIVPPSCALSISPSGPLTMPKGTTEVLTADDANGTVTWSSSKSAWVSVVPASGATTTAEAHLKNRTVVITATDSAPAGCTATITINTVRP